MKLQLGQIEIDTEESAIKHKEQIGEITNPYCEKEPELWFVQNVLDRDTHFHLEYNEEGQLQKVYFWYLIGGYENCFVERLKKKIPNKEFSDHVTVWKRHWWS